MDAAIRVTMWHLQNDRTTLALNWHIVIRVRYIRMM